MRSGRAKSPLPVPETIELIGGRSRPQILPISIRRRQGLPPAAFIAYIQICISSAALILGIGFLILFTLKTNWNTKNDGPIYDKQLFQGGIMYSTLVVIASSMDLFFGLLLKAGARRMNSEYCLFWYRATLMSTVIFFFETLAFSVLLKSPFVFLGVLPSLAFKPFALIYVDKFIELVLKRKENCRCTSKSDTELIRAQPKVETQARNAKSLNNVTAVRHENEVKIRKKTL